MHFLTDPGWIGAIIGALALIITIVLYLAARQKKSLRYELISEYPLININDEVKGKLEVLFNGKPVVKLHLLLVKFTNDGRIPITSGDYERPLTICFKQDSNILSAEYVDPSPENLLTQIDVNSQNVIIQPLLMNSGDFFTIKILLSEYSGGFNVDTRIVGVKNLRIDSSKIRTKRLGVAGGSPVLRWVVLVMMILSFSSILFFPIFEAVKERTAPPPVIESVESSKQVLRFNEFTHVHAEVRGDKNLTYEWFTTGDKF